VFQPAEETGEGAKHILVDPLFVRFFPDYIFAMHNIPGVESGVVLIKKEQFASASKGIIIKFKGKPAHAAYPENGVSPALAMAELITRLNDITLENEMFTDFVLITIIHATLGERAFGTAPDRAEVMATLRSYNNTNMKRLVHECILLSEEIAMQHGLKVSINWTDQFDETYNHPEAIEIIEQVAKSNQLGIKHLPYPYRWSEDFGQFTSKFKGAMFGIGSGKEHPALHSADYDFPDEIIETGVKIFYGITELLLTENK
jgi:amidohydrolase